MKCLLSLVAGVLFVLTAAAAEPSRGAAGGEPPQVLFIGNSLTYYNSLPALVVYFGNFRGQAIFADQHAPGATSLRQHADNPEVAKKIAVRHWTHVVLQDQSGLPASMPEETLRSGKKLCEQVRKAGAVPVFYLTWGYPDQEHGGMNVEMQHQLTLAYCEAAKAGNALLAPVGPAWQAALAKNPKLPLYVKGDYHPSSEGSYLAACVLYAILTKQSPVGLPAKISVPVKERTYLVLADLSRSRAEFYQKVAWETVQGFSVEKFLNEEAAREAKLPTVAEAKTKLKKAMSLTEVIRALGEPPSQRNDKNRVYLFKLQGRQTLWVVYGPDNVISSCQTIPDQGAGGGQKIELP